MTRPTRRRLAAIVLLGPLVGAIALGALSLLFPSTTGTAPLTRALTLVSAGYGLGLIPAALAAAGYWLAFPRIHNRSTIQILLVCLAIGGLSGGISVGVSMLVSGHPITPALIAAGAAAGALALAFTALPFRSRAP